VPGSHPQHAGTAGADEQPWPALLRGKHIEIEAGDLVGGPGVIYLGAIKQAVDDGEGLFKPVYALPRGLKRNASRRILGLVPPCSHAELKPAAREVVEARRLVGDDHRVPEVVGQHQRAHVQACSHSGRGRQGAKRSELLAVGTRREVVAHEEHVDPAVLDPANMVEPRRPAGDGLVDDTEPEPVSHLPPQVNASGTQPDRARPRAARKNSRSHQVNAGGGRNVRSVWSQARPTSGHVGGAPVCRPFLSCTFSK
jgi:hypothetical protein